MCFSLFLLSSFLSIATCELTVSGLSAGAFAAVQFQFSYSNEVSGAAVFAGGPFYCAQGSLTTAVGSCMSTYLGIPNTSSLIDTAKQYASNGLIANVSNVGSHATYVYAGTLDSIVDPSVGAALHQMYESLGANSYHEDGIKSEHCWPTLNFGEACGSLGTPFIGKCDYDGAGVALSHIMGKSLAAPGTPKAAHLQKVSQSGCGSSSSMGPDAYVYVPDGCSSSSCDVHVSLHGCKQTIDDIGQAFIYNTSVTAYAETNNFIVVFPQAVRSMSPMNPEGCFDWWGYTDENYATSKGVQNSCIYNIVTQVASKYNAKL